MNRLSSNAQLKPWLFLILCTLVLCFGTHAWASAPTPSERDAALGRGVITRFSHIGLDEGLSQSDIRTISQDRDGFLWFGSSRNGLNRFDGLEVRTYSNAPEAARSLGHNFIRATLVDQDGRLWVGTAGGGLYRYDANTDDFDSFKAQAGNKRSLPHNSVLGIAQDSQGRLWFATRGGIALYNPLSADFDVVSPKATDYKAPNLSSLRCVLVDRRGRLIWFGSSDGLIAFDPETKACRIFTIPEKVSTGPARNAIIALQQGPDNRLWLGSEDGLYVLENAPAAIPPGVYPVSHDKFSRIDQPGIPGLSLSDTSVNCLLLAEDQFLWIGTNHGLNHLDLKTGALRQLLHEPGDPQSLSDDIILALFLDSQKTLWVGTQYGGVNRMMSVDKPFRKFIHKPGDPNSLTHNFVTSLARDQQQRLWVGTTGGLNCIEGEKVTRHLHRQGDPNSLSANLVTDLETGPDGSLWISTLVGGLNRWDGKRFQNYLRPNASVLPVEGNQAFTGNNIDSLYIDPKGLLWIGARSYGLDVYDGVSFDHRGQITPTGARRPVDNAMLGYTDAEGNLWFGSAQRGLIKHDPRAGTYESFIYDPSGPHSSQSAYYHDLHGDAKGRLWIATVTGLLCFDTTEKRFLARFGKTDGLPSDTITSLLEDKEGCLWLGTTRGLVQFDMETRKVLRVYTRSNGLPSNEFSIGAALRDADGRLWFGTVGGLCSFHPDQLIRNDTPPPLVLTELALGDRITRAGDPGSPLKGPLHRSEGLVLPRSTRVFSIKFAALDFSAPESNAYAYRMDGFDKTWRHTTATLPLATYTNLPPGNYRFVVKGANSDGVWNEVGCSLPIEILPAWHETTLFRLLAGAALLLSTLGAFTWRMRAIRHRTRVLQETVDQRTSELRAAKDELEERVEKRTAELAHTNEKLTAEINERQRAEAHLQQAQKMEAIGQLAGGIAHDFNNILTVIMGNAESASLPDSSPEETQESLAEINDAALRARHLTRQLLVFSRRETMQCMPVDAIQVVADLTKMLARLIGEDITLQLRPLVKTAPLWADPSMLEQVLINMAVNARDAMPKGGELIITITEEPGPSKVEDPHFICIQIRDTGKGIPPEILPHIFEPFFTTKQRGQGTGLGLATSTSIIQQHGGRIEVQSQVGLGTEFLIYLPKRDEALIPTTLPPPTHSPDHLVADAPSDPAFTVLLVEDEPTVRMSTARMLRRLGYSVLEAGSARAGLKVWRKHSGGIDLLISDIVMPGEQNGRDMAMEIRQEKPELPVLLISGYDPDLLHAKVELSNFPRLEKPFTTQQLADATSALLKPLNQR